MNWHWASCSIAILALAATSASPAPRAGNPCKQLRHDLDRRIDDLKVQQKDELQQCELSNGEGSGECLLLKDQQKQALRAMRDNRTLQMSNCSGHLPFAGLAIPIVADLNPSCVNQSYSQYPDNYPDNDEYPPKIRDPHHRHHHPHYPSHETKAKAGPVNKATPVSETSVGKNPHANTLTADSPGRNAALSAGHNYGGRTESAGSHTTSSLSSAGGSSSHSGSASFGSSHSSGGGSGFSGGASSSHSSAASSSSSSSSSSNSSGGHH